MSYSEKFGMACMIAAAIIITGFLTCCFAMCFTETVRDMMNKHEPIMGRIIAAVFFITTLLMLITAVCIGIGISNNIFS